jgi:hypothetical protein
MGFLSDKVEKVYLVEVKTGVVEKGLADFGERLSSNYAKIVPKAKSFGFTPILLKVGLAEDWTFHISCGELELDISPSVCCDLSKSTVSGS